MLGNSLGTVYAEIRLKVADFKKDVQETARDMDTLKKDIDQSFSKTTEIGRGMQTVGKGMSKYVTAPIMGFATAAVYAGTQFDAAMSEVSAISGATSAEFEKLRQQARDLGGTTKYTATEAAEGMTMLARAGFDTNEVMSAMPGMLALAAAGNLELSSAADIVSDTMMAFGENADQAGRYADVFAKAAASGNTTVEGLGQAMSYGASTAAAMNMSVEDSAAIMTAFADAGFKGTRAGTTFEAVMRDLRKSAMDNEGALKYMTEAGEEVSIAWYDAEGNARPFVDVLGDLEDSLEGATVAERDFAMSQLVNSAAMRGLNTLIQRGSDDLRDLSATLYDAEGSADEMAATMLDNLAGSLQIMKSAVMEVMLVVSDILEPVIRRAADGLRDFAQWFSNLSPAIQKVVVYVALFIAAIGPLLLFFGTLLVMLPSIVKGFALFKGAMALVLLPAIKVIAIVAALIAIGTLLYRNWEKIAEFGAHTWEVIKEGWGNLGTWLTDLFTGIGDFFVQVWSDISETFSEAIENIIEWFTELPNNIRTGIENFVLMIEQGIESAIDWFVNLHETVGEFVRELFLETIPNAVTNGITWLVDKVTEGVTSTIEWFGNMVPQVIAFFQKLFFEDIPYWVGYGLGTMVRLAIEGITATVQFFSELPGKVLEFLIQLWTYVSTRFTEIKDSMIARTTEAIDSVVAWFSGLPDRVMAWLTELWTRVTTRFNEIKTNMQTRTREAVDTVTRFFSELPGKVMQWVTETWTRISTRFTEITTTMRTKASEAISAAVEWFATLPERIWTWLTNTVTRVTRFGSNARTEAVGAGKQVIGGFIGEIANLPSRVWEIFTNVGTTIRNAGTNMWNSAKSAAGNLWEGFKSGLGINSPSYLEKAMFQIVDVSEDTLGTMKKDFRTLGNIKVKPPAIDKYGDTLRSGLNDVQSLLNTDQSYAFDGTHATSASQVVRHEHGGTLEVQGVNDEGELVDTVRIVMDELRREVRT